MDSISESENENDVYSGLLTNAPGKPPKNRNDPSIATYDEAFNKAGFGLWQYIILLQCGWANVSDAIEIMCISFFLPFIRDTMHVSHASLSALTFVLFFGMMIGGYFWGSLADTYGRKQTICISLIVNAVFGALSATSTTYWALLLFRFFSGFGAGGSVPVCFTYFSEFQPTKHRGSMISALATCWMLGNILVALLAWAILPVSPIIAKISPFGQQWRFFAILCAIPSLTSGILFFFMPASPKFLYVNNQPNESLKVLNKVYQWNNFRHCQTPFNIDQLIPHVAEHHRQKINDDETDNLVPSTVYREPSPSRIQRLPDVATTFLKNIKNWKLHMSQVYARPRRFDSINLTVVVVLVAFCGYGMAMWTPVLMEKTERYNGSPCRGHAANATSLPSSSNDSAEVYIDVLIGYAAQLPGNILTILIMDKLGSKVVLTCSLYISGLSVLFFWLVEAKTQVIAMNGMYNALSAGVWNSFDVIMVEMYPTNIRSTATGHLTGIGRVGSILGTAIFGLFMDLDCGVPILSVFTLYVITGTLALKLPNTRNIAFD